MRKLQVISTFAVLVALTCGSSFASAATWGAGAYGAFNSYSMKDWNDAIASANSSGSDIAKVDNGLTGGLDLRMWSSPTWLFTAGWEPILLSTEDKASPGDKLSLNANAFTVTGAHFFPTGGNGKFGIGAGVGYYLLGGKFESTGSPTEKLEGSTVGFHFTGLSEWTVSPGFAVTAAAGYRIANIGEVKDNGAVLLTPSGDKLHTDYSGFEGRVGFAYYIPTASK